MTPLGNGKVMIRGGWHLLPWARDPVQPETAMLLRAIYLALAILVTFTDYIGPFSRWISRQLQNSLDASCFVAETSNIPRIVIDKPVVASQSACEAACLANPNVCIGRCKIRIVKWRIRFTILIPCTLTSRISKQNFKSCEFQCLGIAHGSTCTLFSSELAGQTCAAPSVVYIKETNCGCEFRNLSENLCCLPSLEHISRERAVIIETFTATTSTATLATTLTTSAILQTTTTSTTSDCPYSYNSIIDHFSATSSPTSAPTTTTTVATTTTTTGLSLWEQVAN